MAANYNSTDHSIVLGIASPLATVAAMLFGFIIASVTFLSSAKDSSLIKAMKDTQMHQQLLSQLHHTGIGLISSCIFMVLSIFSPSKPIIKTINFNWDYSLLIIGFFLLLFSMIEFWFCWKRVNLMDRNLKVFRY
ncbi:hypothetical protein [Photobacterium carnosum]|uniref:hypothetical protein n=1 Tax=Photobacterium carnosum TaxID=2023717 RepID=UPI001E2C4C4D|nr:hypothetical protein [Photobacterium carnosum]MCD9500365.1 hypothetical protein [Photobacterium carnosum]